MLENASGKRHCIVPRLLQAFAFGTILLCVAPTNAARSENYVNIGFAQRLEATEKIRNTVRTIVTDELNSHFPDGHTPPRIQVQLTFDNQKLQSDATMHQLSIEQEARRVQESVGEQTKALIRDLTQPPNTARREPIQTSSTGMRFGRLNIDIDQRNFEKIITAPVPSANAPQISLLLSNPEAVHKPFIYDPLNYLSHLDIQVSVPSNSPIALQERIKDLIHSSLHLDGFGEGAKDWVNVTTNEPPQRQDAIDWAHSLWSPENQTLGLLLAGISLGLFAVIAAMMLARMLGRIASGLTELKPTEAASEGSADDHDHSGVSSDAVVIDAEAEDGSGDRRKHDAQAATTALTSEMKNIRAQLEEIISEKEQLVAELIMDLFYEKHGLEDFRDLLSFAGYKALKPAMEKLPRKAIVGLQTYIEDSREADVNLLNGCEVAQRLYRDSVSKITTAESSVSDELLQSLKSTLVGTDDSVIQELAAEIEPTMLSIVLRNLSNERGNVLMRSLPADKLKEACELLDSKVDNETEIINSLIKRLNESQSKVKEVSHLQRRFIIRLAKSASLSEESSIIDLVPPDDVSLRRALMEVRFFVRDLIHLPEKQLKKIFDTIDLSTRAEILVATDSELKDRLQNLYPDGSKVREMLTYEVESLETDQSRVDAIKRKSDTLLELLTSKAKAAVNKDHSLLDKVLNSICGTHAESEAIQNETAA